MAKVVTYANNGRQCFCQIKFESGERILISIAGPPNAGVKIMKLLLGFIPTQTVWEYTAAMAGDSTVMLIELASCSQNLSTRSTVFGTAYSPVALSPRREILCSTSNGAWATHSIQVRIRTATPPNPFTLALARLASWTAG